MQTFSLVAVPGQQDPILYAEEAAVGNVTVHFGEIVLLTRNQIKQRIMQYYWLGFCLCLTYNVFASTSQAGSGSQCSCGAFILGIYSLGKQLTKDFKKKTENVARTRIGKFMWNNNIYIRTLSLTSCYLVEKHLGSDQVDVQTQMSEIIPFNRYHPA